MLKIIYALLVSLTLASCSCARQSESNLPVHSPSKTDTTESNPVPDVDPYFVETQAINRTEGPASITRNVVQDRKGNIWLATWEGIISYDGESFTNFTNKERLRRFHVFSVLEDRNGILWFGTIGAGVYRFDGRTFVNFTTRDGLPNDRIGCIYEDQAGNIWIGTEGGISRYDGSSFRNLTTQDGLTNNDINSIIQDSTGRFWIGTRGEACLFDGTSFTRFTTDENAPFENVRSIIEDRKGNIWLGGNNGLWRYDGSEFSKVADGFAGYVYEDTKGNIWTSSAADGQTLNWVLSRYDEQTSLDANATPTQIKQEDGLLFGILEDKAGNIWFGTLKGVCRYDGKSFATFQNAGTGR